MENKIEKYKKESEKMKTEKFDLIDLTNTRSKHLNHVEKQKANIELGKIQLGMEFEYDKPNKLAIFKNGKFVGLE